MAIGHFLLVFALVLFGAWFLAQIAGMLKIPAVIGELMAGVILGPSLFNLIRPDEIWTILAEIGIILLLFEAGLETDFIRLTRTGKKPYAVASWGFLFPFILAFCLSYFVFHLSLLVALFIGGTLTATSIGITVRVLQDLGQRQTHEAQIVIGAAVLDDILGVLLLALLYDFALTQQFNGFDILKQAIAIILFMLCAPLLVKILMSFIAKINKKIQMPGLLLVLSLSLILLCSAIADRIGAPAILGGFAAGLALSRQFGWQPKQILRWSMINTLRQTLAVNTRLTDQLERQIKPFIHIFAPIFFVMVGASLNLHDLPWYSWFFWGLTLSLLSVAILGKFLAGFMIKESLKLQAIIGISMIPRGEVGLIFAQLGLMTHIFSSLEYAALIAVVALTTFIPPFVLRAFYHYRTSSS